MKARTAILTQPASAIGLALLSAVLKALLFIAGSIVAGIWVIPVLVRSLARTGSQELLSLGILALCLGIALITSAIGLSIEMGAFVAGLMISNVEYADNALDRVLPLRDVFATLFFASIGVLIDPGFLLANLGTLLGLVTVTLIGKAAIVTGTVKLFGYPLKTALKVRIGINQIGEFSFVLAGVAVSEGLLTQQLYGLTVGTTAATLLITPFLLKATPYLLIWLERLPVFNDGVAGLRYDLATAAKAARKLRVTFS